MLVTDVATCGLSKTSPGGRWEVVVRVGSREPGTSVDRNMGRR